MQVLTAPLRAFLFCIEFIFGKLTSVKPSEHLHISVLVLSVLANPIALSYTHAAQPPSHYFVIEPWIYSLGFPRASYGRSPETAAGNWIAHWNAVFPSPTGYYTGVNGCTIQPYVSATFFWYLCEVEFCTWYGAQIGLICESKASVGVLPYCSNKAAATWNGTTPTCPDTIPTESNKGLSCPSTKRPINIATGNKYLYEQDDPGFTRYFNSQAITTPSALGTGWQHTYQRELFNSPSTASVAALREDGKTYNFAQSSSGYTGQPSLTLRLSPLPLTGGWQLTNENDEVEIYGANGKLLSITDRRGLTQTLTYSDGTTGPNGGYVLDAIGNPTTKVLSVGLLIQVTDAYSRSLVVGYDASKRIVKMTDPSNGVYLYGYDEASSVVIALDPPANNLTSVTYPDGSKRIYWYNEQQYTANAKLPNALTGITDENNVRHASYYYDATSRAIKEEMGSSLALGIDKYTLSYDIPNVKTTVTDPLGSARTYNFQTILGVVKTTGTSQPGGSGCGPASSNLTYDPNGNIKTRADFNGNTTWFDYDLSRNLETVRTEAYATPLARTINTTWHPNFRLPTSIIEPGRITEMSYDPTSGNMLSRKITSTADAKVRQWTYTYTTASDGTLATLLKSVDGPRTDVSDVTTYTYYPNGDLLSVSNALSHTTQITSYDPHGRPLTLIDPNSLTTTLSYWPRGWLKSRSVGPETTFYDYDGVGQIKQITLPSGAFVRYDYDDAHRLTDIWDQDNNRIHYTLDKMGNRIQEDTYDALGARVATKNRTFDALSRLFQEIDAVNSSTGIRPTTTYGYDANGNSTWVLPPNQPATSHQYDALNRLFKTTDALLGITQYAYDNLDQLKSVTDPRSLVTNYNVNALGDQTKLTSPDTGITNKTYDAAGNLSTNIDARNQQTAYTYDALNRVTGMSYTSGAPVGFSYDQGINGKGRLTGMTDESGSTQWSYDAQGRVVTKTATTNNLPQTLRYRYDAQGRLDQITYPSGKLVALGYLANKITSINADNQPVLTGVQYHPFSGPKLWYFGNNSLVNRNYDQSNRLFAYSLGNATRSLAFDDSGRISNIADSLNLGLTQNMGYDNLDRLTSWVTGTGNQSFTYDPNGNRTNLTLGASNYSNSIAPTSNRISAVAGPTAKTYGYDLAGNIQTDSKNTFNYNARGRLQSVTNNSGTETYQVNGLGQRVVKSGLINVRFVFDESGKLIGEYTPSGALIQETVYLGDLPVAVLR